jgi:hypothetical protein
MTASFNAVLLCRKRVHGPPRFASNGHQSVVVFGTVALKISDSDIRGLIQHALLTEKECNQQSADTPVSIQERVDSLKLGVS